MQERVISKGTIIKPKGHNFTTADEHSKILTEDFSSVTDSQKEENPDEKSEVFVIKTGVMGLFVYSYGHKKLMTTFTTQEVVGEWTYNFLYSKAAQYEALTDMEIVYFSKFEYEKVMWESKTNTYQNNFKFFSQFKQFRGINEHLMKRLWAIAKTKKFSNWDSRSVSQFCELQTPREEFVTLNGCNADWLYIVLKGTFRAERYVTIENENLWPVKSDLWKSKKIRHKVSVKYETFRSCWPRTSYTQTQSLERMN